MDFAAALRELVNRERTAVADQPPTDLEPARTDPAPSASSGGPTADMLPPEWFIWYEERAAIREFDGGQTRADAERDALAETLAAMRAAGE